MHFLKYWLPLLLYMALIFYVSALPHPPLPPVDWTSIDKVYHLLEYTVFSFLVARAFLHTSHKIVRSSPWLFALLFVCLYAASDEWHQSFVQGRFSSVADWIADCLGGLLGMAAAYLWRQLSKARIDASG